VSSFPRSKVRAIFCSLALTVAVSSAAEATPQDPATDLPVSTQRIREKLGKAPPKLKVQTRWQQPVATFKSRVDERITVLTFQEWLDKEFTLNDLQRQSADWAARCCGLRLDPLIHGVGEALERRKVRKVRAQIASELRELESARKRATPEKR
jgi:hypothetical protein